MRFLPIRELELGPCKKYPGLSSVAAEKPRAGGRIFFLFFTHHI
jgi:hypothetical protein